MNIIKSLPEYAKKILPKNPKRILLILVIFFAGIGLIGAFTVLYYAFQVPDPSTLAVRRVNESTKIYDRKGETILYDVHGEEKRTVVAWEKIPQIVRDATLAAEDADFYKHQGVDIKGIFRALWKDFTSLSASQGGSTITQQLVKKTLIGDEKTISRKIKEAILAIQIERTFSKDQIFWMYLNQIPYGSNAYGIESASQTFFGKSALELNTSQAAILAALPQRPSYYSPYGNHLDELIGRRDYVLRRMRDLNFITTSEYDTAISEIPEFVPPQDDFPAPHFVIMVREYLINKYGEDFVQNGGLRVITTLDKEKQEIAESVVTKYGDINEKRYRADNASLVAVDPKTGQLLAMVGSRDYFNIERNGNYNVALAKIRQPGSSFKPFAYATALAKGYPDSTIIFDVPTEFNPTCSSSATQTTGAGECYHPRNYLGNFSGPVTIRQALARSLNIPAVKVLYLAGVSDTVATARSMGITSLDPNSYYGLSLVLGGAGVSLYDMVTGYSVFANDGLKAEPTFILKITTSDGGVLEEYEAQEERAISSEVARTMSSILSDNNARAPVFGFSNPLYMPSRPVAAKTGTTQNNRDGWLIGYTPSLAAGVWTGNNDDSPMTATGAGSSAAGPMWNEFMTKALSKTPIEYFLEPQSYYSDKTMLNGEYRSQFGIHSILHYVSLSDPRGPIPQSPSLDAQYRNWEASVRNWVYTSGENEFPSVTPIPEQTIEPLPTPLLF